MRKISLIIVTILSFFILFSGCSFFLEEDTYEVTQEEYEFLKSYTKADYEKLLTNYNLFFSAMDYCEENYYTDINYESADIAAAIAYVDSLDRYSALQLSSSLASQAVGIGLSLEVTLYNEYRITYIHPGSPAAAVSTGGTYTIQRGDYIYKVNGVRVENTSYSTFSALSAGGIGTELTLTIKRGSNEIPEDFVCVKGNLSDIMKEAYYYNDIIGLPASVGYIKLLSFTGDAVEDFVSCIGQFINDGNEKLILDLRGNGGGSSTILSEIGNYLVYDENSSDNIPIIELINKDGISQTFNTNQDLFIDVPIAVLVNKNTASASEALTSAMMFYNENTMVIGEKTYGKGTALNSSELIMDDGVPYNISIVVGEYYVYTDNAALDILDGVSDGKWCIDEVGLTPDMPVEDRTFGDTLAEDTDIQAAIGMWFPE